MKRATVIGHPCRQLHLENPDHKDRFLELSPFPSRVANLPRHFRGIAQPVAGILVRAEFCSCCLEFSFEAWVRLNTYFLIIVYAFDGFAQHTNCHQRTPFWDYSLKIFFCKNTLSEARSDLQIGHKKIVTFSPPQNHCRDDRATSKTCLVHWFRVEYHTFGIWFEAVLGPQIPFFRSRSGLDKDKEFSLTSFWSPLFPHNLSLPIALMWSSNSNSDLSLSFAKLARFLASSVNWGNCFATSSNSYWLSHFFTKFQRACNSLFSIKTPITSTAI